MNSTRPPRSIPMAAVLHFLGWGLQTLRPSHDTMRMLCTRVP
jgi:hypothetical protein